MFREARSLRRPLIAISACVMSAGGPAMLGRRRRDLHAWTDPTTVRIGLWEEPHTLDPVISSMSFEYDVYQARIRRPDPLRRTRAA